MAAIQADFSASPASGAAAAPAVVAFTDGSTPGPSGPITAHAWDFGDGGTSTSANPTHTFAAVGTYPVRLTVAGTSPDGGSSVRHLYVVLADPPPPPSPPTQVVHLRHAF